MSSEKSQMETNPYTKKGAFIFENPEVLPTQTKTL